MFVITKSKTSGLEVTGASSLSNTENAIGTSICNYQKHMLNAKLWLSGTY